MKEAVDEPEKPNIQEAVTDAVRIIQFKGTVKECREAAHAYADKVDMNEYNRNALKTLKVQGEKEMVKHVFTDQSNPERQLSYAEMRARYG